MLALSLLLVNIWNLCARSWQQAQQGGGRQRNLALALLKLDVQLRDSPGASAIYQNTPNIPALAFCSAWGIQSTGQSGNYTYQNGTLLPMWQKYAVCYLDTVNSTLDYAEIPISSTDLASNNTIPLDEWNGPWGVQPLTFYCVNGTRILSGVNNLNVQRQGGTINITVGMPPDPTLQGAGNSPLSLCQTVWLHN